jgi:non-ribosomal peptide synthase protein (TIGR01720 family)
MEKVADDVNAGLDLHRGPLLRAVLFDLGTGRRPMLFVTAHHLVVDGVSWRILTDDLETGYRQAAAGEPVDLGPKTTSVRDWSARLGEFVRGGGLDHELDHWADTGPARPLPVDHPPAAGDGEPDGGPPAPGRTVSVRLSTADTEALLRRAPTAYRTGVNDVLLTALGWALSRWTGDRTVSVDLEGHGREEVLDGVDLSRTVGWFTTLYPVTLQLPAPGPAAQADSAGPADPVDPEPPGGWRALVKAIRRQLRAVPGNGFGYGALRYLGSPAAADRLPTDRPDPQVVFNYLGQWDAAPAGDPGPAGSAGQPGPAGLVHAVHGSLGQDHDPADADPHLLEIVGAAHGGRLEFTWYYRPDRHEPSTVESVADDFVDALRRIARDCRGTA